MIAAGGTAGHVVPALAVADALRAEGAEVEFIGGDRAEAELVPAAGYPLHRIAVEGLSRTQPAARAARALALAAAAAPALALAAALSSAPDAVLGGGGYVAGPVGLAALTPAPAAGADRGRQPSRPHQPRARAVRAPRLPGLPARRARGAALPRHRAPGARRGQPIAAARGRASDSAEGDTCVLVFGGLARRALRSTRPL